MVADQNDIGQSEQRGQNHDGDSFLEMIVRDFLSELYRRSPVLTATGWIHLGLLIPALMIAPFDDRQILGLNPWIKPMKFLVSIAIYTWTIAWLLAYISGPRWAKSTIAWGTAVAMLLEVACIVLQAARGIPSHFNFSTPFDATVFSVMGSMIAVNTLLAVLLLALFFIRPMELPKAILWGIRLGMVIFLLGSALGNEMVNRLSHTIGAPDGGPGLPLVNWSTTAGDLRIAHLIGLHGLQILPLVGFLFSRRQKGDNDRRPLGYLTLFALGYAGIMFLFLLQALQGKPMIGL